MTCIREILVYWPGAPPGSNHLARIESLAHSTGAKLTLADVVDQLPRDLLRLVPSQGPARLMELAVDEAYQRLVNVAGQLRLPPRSMKIKVLQGPVVKQLLQEAAQGGYDLLVLNQPRRRLFWRWDAVIKKLIRESPVPVMLLREGLRPRAALVLAAVNPVASQCPDGPSPHEVINWAAAVARAEGAQLHIAHCWNLAGENVLASTGGLPRRHYLHMLLQERKQVRAALSELLERCDLGGIDIVPHLPKGEAGELIPRLAGSVQADLLVLGMPVRSGFRGFLLGNLAEDILRAARCPVLAVRDSGLSQPLQRRAA